MGHCERYQALGAEHPKQACYVVCSAKCIVQATKDGDLPEGAVATSGIVATTGVDSTKAMAAANRSAGVKPTIGAAVSKPFLPPVGRRSGVVKSVGVTGMYLIAYAATSSHLTLESTVRILVDQPPTATPQGKKGKGKSKAASSASAAVSSSAGASSASSAGKASKARSPKKSPSSTVKAGKRAAPSSAGASSSSSGGGPVKPFKQDARSSWDRLDAETHRELKKLISTPRCTIDEAYGISKGELSVPVPPIAIRCYPLIFRCS